MDNDELFIKEAARDIALMQENIREGYMPDQSQAVIDAYIERLTGNRQGLLDSSSARHGGMSNDAMIEAVARAIEKSLAWDVEHDVYAAETTHEERCKIARAAINAAAPFILDMAAEHCRKYMADCLDDRDIQKNWPRTKGTNDVYARHILALKERFGHD